MSYRYWIPCLLLLNACASAPTPAPAPERPRPPAQINYDEIQNRLGLDLPPGQTGYKEKSFDACDLGEALSSLPEPLANCHHAIFALIQYQLSCRQEEQPGAVLTEADLEPVANQRLKWTMDKSTGYTQTNERGEGRIRVIRGASMKRSPLKISNGVDFMLFRANEVTAIVTPASWCRTR